MTSGDTNDIRVWTICCLVLRFPGHSVEKIPLLTKIKRRFVSYLFLVFFFLLSTVLDNDIERRSYLSMVVSWRMVKAWLQVGYKGFPTGRNNLLVQPITFETNNTE